MIAASGCQIPPPADSACESPAHAPSCYCRSSSTNCRPCASLVGDISSVMRTVARHSRRQSEPPRSAQHLGNGPAWIRSSTETTSIRPPDRFRAVLHRNCFSSAAALTGKLLSPNQEASRCNRSPLLSSSYDHWSSLSTSQSVLLDFGHRDVTS